ncbi:carbamoyltransferase HypF [Nocardia colli]|uniref:Carbamoyltransferase HypF n=2 Tax=Nocardia colli TaxID=2545717 RepID=A0A5N0E9H8_9NOCA|nr:carbamoyltransferase HypF [Nocardia colli]
MAQPAPFTDLTLESDGDARLAESVGLSRRARITGSTTASATAREATTERDSPMVPGPHGVGHTQSSEPSAMVCPQPSTGLAADLKSDAVFDAPFELSGDAEIAAPVGAAHVRAADGQLGVMGSGVLPAASVAPGNPDLGVMIAYAPLHLLLFGLPGDSPGPRVLVMTSGNLGGEPICYDDEDARIRLTGLADGWLSHNRRILVPCDDSVVRLVDGIELPVRRSRGYAPLPLALPIPMPPTLAVGADLKNTCAVADGRYAWLSQHIGDMDDLATLRAFGDAEHHLEQLTGVEPIQIVADAHPRYRSTAWAQRNAGDRPVRLVQHHHAHIASVMGEHGLGAAATVLGIAFDGTGFGPDGAVWGGEVLAAGYKGFRRLARLKYAPLAGGDVSVHRPYRMALAHLWAAGIEWSDSIPSVRACPPAERAVLRHQFETGLGCVPTSSMGRLFDAVSSLAGVRHVVDYEAQAAIELEGLARGVSDEAGYRFEIATDEPALLDPAPVLAAVIADAAQGVPASVIGARFHDAVAHLILELAVAYSTPSTPVALSGGVFQNALLLSRARGLLQDNGFHVISHRRLPPNDGGLAFGQLLAVSAG